MLTTPSVQSISTFCRYKVYDNVGNGSYRKFVMLHKEEGNQWAENIISCVKDVNLAVRKVAETIIEFKDVGHQNLYTVCTAVIDNSVPPIDLVHINGKCFLTGKNNCQCIQIKDKKRAFTTISVQVKFYHFFKLLWATQKLDTVIKTFTKDFIIRQRHNGEVDSVQLTP